MLKINIKPKVAEQPKKNKVSGWVIFICLLLLIIAFAISGFLYISNANLTRQEKTVEQNIASQKAANTSLLELDQKAKALNKTINDIKTLSQQSISFPSMLKEIAARTPHDVQIKSLTCDTTPGKGKVDISGQAASRRSIMEFRSELEKSNLFSNVNFESSSQTEGNNFDYKITMDINKVSKK
jgi:Tfp pilus assembly protein PilN